MKPIFIILIAIGTGIIGGCVGFITGASIGAVGGVAGGALLGVCTTLDTAKAEGLIAPQQVDEIMVKVKERVGKEYNLTAEDLAQLSCEELNR